LAPEKDVLFAETVDPTYLAQIFKKMEEVYSQGKNILVFLVSKSGTTIESVANFGAIIGRLKRLYKDWQNYVVAITDPGTPLFEYAKKNKIDSISMPPSIGGRYSVLTPVGLLPAKVFGLNIRDIMVGARSVVKDSLSLNMKKNYALQNAATVFLNLKAKKTIYNLFIFSPRLKYVGQWWRQIIAESLGKDGKGITPIVSLGTTDLHSVTQLYLDGPKDKFTTFVSVKDFGRDFKISGEIELFRLAKGLEGRTIEEVMSIIFQAVEKSYKKQKLPYTECILNSISEESLGAFFQLKMIETAFLGYLLKVNPYNEPAVDIYKAEMRKILSKEN
jgi:glucose-6-phosphate isomerase